MRALLPWAAGLFLMVPPLAAQEPAQEEESTTIGGYGEVHYTNASGPDSPGEINVARFVGYLAHTFNQQISLHSELEVEDTKVEGGEAGGEVSVEQVYLDYRFSPAFTLRAGVRRQAVAPRGGGGGRRRRGGGVSGRGSHGLNATEAEVTG